MANESNGAALPGETDVLIVGGGLAGLTSGVALSREGLTVTVLEQDTILGGRARSWTDAKTGDPVHIGPHIFLTEYPNMWKLLDMLGTRDRVVWEHEQLIKIVEGRNEIVGKTWRLPPPLHFLPSFFADKALPLLDRASIVPITLYAMQINEDDVQRLDGMNGYSFLRGMGVTQAYIERFWDPTSMYIMNAPVDLVSAGSLMRFYRFLIGRSDYKIGFPDGGLGDVYAPQARALIEANGSSVHLGTSVGALLRDERQRVTGVKLRDGREIRARHVILAVPPKAVLDLVPQDWIVAHRYFGDLTAFHAIPYISVFLWFDRKLSPGRFWARLYKPGDLNSDFYDLSNIHRGWEARPSLITSNIIFSSRLASMTDEEIVSRTVEEIADYLPIAREARIEHSVVNRIPMAVHAPFPGTERRRPVNRTPIEGLYVAGDWTRTEIPACMESATRSGFQATEAILADLGRPKSFAVRQADPNGISGFFHRLSKTLPLFKARLPWVDRMAVPPSP